MRTNIFLWVVISIVVITEVYLLYTNRKLSSELAVKDQFLNRILDHCDAAETQFSANIEDAGKIIDGNIIAKDTADNATSLSEITKQSDDNILICRYSDRMCRECVEHTISVFTDNMDSLDMKRILFLPQNTSKRVFKLNFEEYGLRGCRVLNCPNLSIDAEEMMFPYIMVVDKDLRVLTVYFPTKSTHGTDYDYKHVKMIYDKMIRR